MTVLACCGLCAGAILVPAPAAVVPLIAICCVGLPMLTGWQVPAAVDTLRGAKANERAALNELRRVLDQLPEIEHPLGL